MKILVTGGAGFIGSHVVDAYVELGHDVVVLDNLSTGRKENVNPKARFVKMDITDKEVENLFIEENFDVVNNHAAQMDVRKSVAEPSFDAKVNILGLLNLLENSAKYGVTKFINVSSGGVIYGEDAELPIKENAPKQPISPYGISKWTGEQYAEFFSTIHGLKITCLRYSNVYGPRQNPHGEAGVVAIFSDLMLAKKQPLIYGTGKQTRDYVYVMDVVKANVLCLDKGEKEAFNIGTSTETSVNELFALMKEMTGYEGQAENAPARPGELQKNCLDINKAKRILGWKPEYQLKDGLKQTVDWISGSKKNNNGN